MAAPMTFTSASLGEAGEMLVSAARAGTARIRADDGDDLLVVPEAQLQAMRFILETAAYLADLRSARSDSENLPADWGHSAWPWLVHLTTSDLDLFEAEVSAAVFSAARTGTVDDLAHLLTEWAATADAWADPLTREVWLGPHRAEDFVEVERPG